MQRAIGAKLEYKRLPRAGDYPPLVALGVPCLFATFSLQPRSDSPSEAAITELIGRGNRGGGSGSGSGSGNSDN